MIEGASGWVAVSADSPILILMRAGGGPDTEAKRGHPFLKRANRVCAEALGFFVCVLWPVALGPNVQCVAQKPLPVGSQVVACHVVGEADTQRSAMAQCPTTRALHAHGTMCASLPQTLPPNHHHTPQMESTGDDDDEAAASIVQAATGILQAALHQAKTSPPTTTSAREALEAVEAAVKDRWLAPVATAGNHYHEEDEEEVRRAHVRHVLQQHLAAGGFHDLGPTPDDGPWNKDPEEEGSYATFPTTSKGGDNGTSFSLFSLQDLPDVVMVDLEAVATQLQAEDAATQQEGLQALEGAILGELAYSENWCGVCRGLARLLSEPPEVALRVVKLYRELFGCLTSGQRADIYLAVAVDLVQAFRGSAWVLREPSSDQEEETVVVDIQATLEGQMLWAKVALLHHMQGQMADFFAHLNDSVVAKVVTWTLVLLRGLHGTRGERGVCPADLLAMLNAEATWFKQWCLRLPPPRLQYLVRRTGLVGDLVHRCECKGKLCGPAGQEEEENGLLLPTIVLGGEVPPAAPATSSPSSSLVAPALLAKRLHVASVCMLAHLFATGCCSGVETTVVPVLWEGAPVLSSTHLPAASSDVTLVLPDPAAATTFQLDISTSATTSQQQESFHLHLVACVELFVSCLTTEASSAADDDLSMAQAASQGLLHMPLQGPSLHDAFRRLVAAAETSHLALTTALRLANSTRSKGLLGGETAASMGPLLASLHRSAIQACSTSHCLTTLLATSLFTICRRSPALIPTPALWPTHDLMPFLAAAKEGQQQEEEEEEGRRRILAHACLPAFACDYRGVEHLLQQPVPCLAGLVQSLTRQTLRRLREEENEEDIGFLPLPTLSVLLQNLASTERGAVVLCDTGLVQAHLLPFLFEQAPQLYGVQFVEYMVCSGPALQPARLHGSLFLVLALLRTVGATHPPLLQPTLAPHVERVVAATQTEGLQELSLRLLISVASTLHGAAWLHTTFPQLDAALRQAVAPQENEELPALDNTVCAAAYLRGLLHQADASPSLPPSPPLLDEDELQEAQVALAVSAAVSTGGLGSGWGSIPTYFFQEQRQLQQQEEPQGDVGGTLPSLLSVLAEGKGMGAEKTVLLPVCWRHVVEAWAKDVQAQPQAPAAAVIDPLLQAKVEMVAVHAVRWGMLPETELESFQTTLLELAHACGNRPPSVWRLGIFLLMACGQADQVLACLPPVLPEADHAVVADQTAEALQRELPEVWGALVWSGVSARALVRTWFEHAFWGVLSVTELAVAQALVVLHGPDMQVGLALALLHHLRDDLLAWARQPDLLRLVHAQWQGLRRFEFTPEVVARWIVVNS